MVKSVQVAVWCSLAALVPAARKVVRRDHADYQTNEHITCPVLAALHRAGALKTDSDGDVEIAQMQDALRFIGNSQELTDFQAFGIVQFDRSQKGKEEISNPCLPPSSCGTKRYVHGNVEEDTKRWMNLFKMNGKQALEHGTSTGIRGGDTNMPPNAIDCGGQYPCEKRFDQFFGDNGTDGRFYREDILKVICKARQYGDRGGKLSYEENTIILLGPVPGREWQIKGAMILMLMSFGRRDENGELYMTMADLRALFLEGRIPDGWQRREHGCLVYGCEDTPAAQVFNLDIPCEVGYSEPFWQNTGCQVDTGRTCGLFKGCREGETCVGRKCLCNRDGTLRTMCYADGACREQAADNYSWFGGQRQIVRAENPGARGNPPQ